MAKVIEFYVRDLFPTNVKSVPRDRGGEVIEFPKDKAAAAGKLRRFGSAVKPTQQLPLGPDVSN
jgi:hypothetical protein